MEDEVRCGMVQGWDVGEMGVIGEWWERKGKNGGPTLDPPHPSDSLVAFSSTLEGRYKETVGESEPLKQIHKKTGGLCSARLT